MEISIRPETKEDYFIIENLVREAFWEMKGRPHGCYEHYLVHKLHQSEEFVKDLCYVALVKEKIIGHILYTKSKIIDNNKEYEILSFGPLSVLPGYQKMGVGKELVTFTLKKAKELNYRAVMIFGHPEYYPRFGFENAEKYGITTSEGKNFDAFMVCELYKDSLKGISGRGYKSSLFNDIDENELREFDKKFQNKI